MRRHPPEDSRLIRAAVLVTVLVAVAAVAAQEEFTAQAAMAAAAICAGSWISYVRRRASNWWLKAMVAVLILVVAREFFTSLLANPYDPRVPLVQLFLWLQALHSFDLPARRDLKYSLASAVILIAVAAVYTREMSFGLFLVAFALSASVTLVVMVAGGRGDVSPRFALTAGAGLAAGVLLSAGVLFAAVPHSQGLRVQWLPVSPRFSFAQRIYDRIVNPAYPDVTDRLERVPPLFNPTGYIGFSDHVDLRLRGILNTRLVMRVRATRPAFWRGLAFDEYTGLGWRMSDRTVDEYTATEPRIVPRYGPDEPWPADSEAVIQTFYIEAEQPNVIFAAYRAFEVYFPAGSLGVDRTAGLRSPVPLEQGLIYSVISRVPGPAPRVLHSAAGGIPAAVRERYLSLPQIPHRVRTLAQSLTAGYRSVYDKALAVNRYLLVNYTYDLQAPPLADGADAVDALLFESRRGSCEAFASAMAVLLRAAGVPARLVTGYTIGHYNVLTGYYEVRNADAHAWVEAYIPRAGWIEFEPTPSFEAPGPIGATAGGQWLLRDAALWLSKPVAPLAAWTAMAAQRLSRVAGRGLHPALASSALVVLGVLLAIGLWRVRALRIATRGGVEGMYGRMLVALARAGHPRALHLTPREFAAAAPIPIRAHVADITRAFEEHRYGGRAISPDHETQLRKAYDDLHTRLGRTRP